LNHLAVIPEFAVMIVHGQRKRPAEAKLKAELLALLDANRTKRAGTHPGRQELPPNLSRVVRVLPCTPDQRVCRSCGKETVVIGYEESSQLDVEPAKYFVLVTKREKRACRSCEELGVVSAPLPPRIIEKCLASDRIVIDTVVSKYCNHTPLHRPSVILERGIGLEISRATLDGLVLQEPVDTNRVRISLRNGDCELHYVLRLLELAFACAFP
jgi:transposase